ncbi:MULTISPECIES: hypothetical protein [Methylobacterium]|uniref:hypothetical protein n=1 Tax=Methylobacterium TaxID=407 RepID=UPI001042BCC4|nr:MULTISPECIES: hypothetical protein [Methylobacterium]MDR7037098.1 hypothetical protein [Methylobacterium sp. BE186]
MRFPILRPVLDFSRRSQETSALCAEADALIDEAPQNVTAIVREKRVGHDTFWDGNKAPDAR